MKKKHHIVFRTIANEWLADVKLRVKRSSYEKYVYILDKHILPFFGSYSMGQLSVRSVDRFMLESSLTASSSVMKAFHENICRICSR